MNDNNEDLHVCISCNGTGILECSCVEEKNCIICQGQGEFSCPICDGSGRF